MKSFAIVEDWCSNCGDHKRVIAIPKWGYFCKKCVDKAFNPQLDVTDEQADDEQ